MTPANLQKNTSNFPKPTEMIVMMPKIGRLTPLGRKLLNVLFQMSWKQLQEAIQQKGAFPSEETFKAPVLEIAGILSRADSDPRALVKTYMMEMRDTQMDYSSPNANTGIVWQDMDLLSYAAFKIEDGVLWALWTFPQPIFKAFLSKGAYTWINLEEMSKLSSYAAIALYEIALRYKNNPSGMTSSNDTDWWTQVLSGVPPKIDKVTGLPKVREWRKFKYETLSDAIAEVNEKTSVSIELHESTIGKAVKGVQFAITKKQTVISADLPKIPKEVALLSARLDINLKFIGHKLKDGFDDDTLILALTRLEARINNKDLNQIESKQAYLSKLLEDSNGIVKPTVVPFQEKKVLNEVLVIKNFFDIRRDEIRAKFNTLTNEEQFHYAQKGSEILKSMKLLTPTIQRRINSKEWKTGVIFDKALEAYGNELYGEGWKTNQSHSQLEDAAPNFV